MTRELPRSTLVQIAVIALEQEPALSVRRAAARAGVPVGDVYVAWRAKHGPRPHRVPAAAYEAVIEPFAALCDDMAEALTPRPQLARTVFARFPEVNERRLWRALKRLVVTGRAVRHGQLHTGAKYTRGGA